LSHRSDRTERRDAASGRPIVVLSPVTVRMPPGVRERLVRVVAELLVLQLEHRAEEQAGSPGGARVMRGHEFLE
jgi:hypothetical protein